MTDDPTSPDAAAWAGLRPQVRSRLAAAVARALATGALSRADLVEIGEVSPNQATADIKTIEARLPGFLAYDTVGRRYRPAGMTAAAAPAPAAPVSPAERFRATRLALGLTQAAMATLMRVDIGSVRRWETGVSAVPGPAAVLSEALADSGAVRRHFGLPADLRR